MSAWRNVKTRQGTMLLACLEFWPCGWTNTRIYVGSNPASPTNLPVTCAVQRNAQPGRDRNWPEQTITYRSSRAKREKHTCLIGRLLAAGNQHSLTATVNNELRWSSTNESRNKGRARMLCGCCHLLQATLDIDNLVKLGLSDRVLASNNMNTRNENSGVGSSVKLVTRDYHHASSCCSFSPDKPGADGLTLRNDSGTERAECCRSTHKPEIRTGSGESLL